MARRTAYQRYCWVCWYAGRCFRVGLEGSFKSATNWAGVIGAGALAFLLSHYGHQIMPAQGWQEIVGQGLLYIVAAWVLIFAFRLVFIAPFIVHREGTWYGTKFVYREPKLAFHAFVSAADNNRLMAFRFLDAPPFCLLSYKVEIEAKNKNFISLFVMSDPEQRADFASHDEFHYSGGSTRVGKKRNLFMKIFMRGDADPCSVRVYVTGWDTAVGAEAPAPTPDKPAAAYWG
jgi:hypothetical protein